MILLVLVLIITIPRLLLRQGSVVLAFGTVLLLLLPGPKAAGADELRSFA